VIEIHKTEQTPFKDLKTRKKGKSAGPFPGTPGVNALESSFLEELKKADYKEEDDKRRSLDEILQNLDEQGRKFQDKPTMEELLKYKSLVRKFLDRTVRQSLKVHDHKGARKVSGQKLYKQIEIIDQKLSDLTLCIIQKETKNINLMARLDEIRGLLIDLKM
jgi:uncharacterized protein YaaR (DUF327 family)